MNRLLVKGFAGSLFDRIHHQQQIGIQRTLHLLARLAGAVAGLLLADRADVVPDGIDVLVDIVAGDGLDRLGYLREKTEQGATGGLLQPALAVYGTLGAYLANPIADNRLYFC